MNSTASASSSGLSHLFAANSTGLPELCSLRATSASSGTMPSRTFATKINTSAPSMASSTCSAIRLSHTSTLRDSPASMPSPPVSISSNRRPFRTSGATTRSRVTPLISWTIDRRRPTIVLKSEDFPTFGRPTIAIAGTPPFVVSTAAFCGMGRFPQWKELIRSRSSRAARPAPAPNASLLSA